MEKSLRYVRNVWLEGRGALCLGIPSEIVKKLELNQNSFLYVELVDNLIVMKKHDPKLTKTELNKITSEKNHTEEKTVVIEEKSNEEEKEFDNPLKDLKI